MNSTAAIQPVGEENRNLRGIDFFVLWAGAAVSLAEIWAGSLLVPLGFLTGLLGVNVGGIPLTESAWGFASVTLFLVVITFFQILYFRRKHWL